MKMDFSGKAVLVVGGSSGIGRACGEAFRDAGAEVMVTGTRAALDDYDGLAGVGYAQLDIADREAVAAFAAGIRRLDVLVNAAGAVMYGRKEFEIGNFEAILATNLTGIFQLCTALRPVLARDAGGAVVNIGSVASHRGTIGQPAYSASKGGLLTLTKTLAQAWGRDGIRVTQVSPGFVQTKMTEITWEDERRLGGIERMAPLGRIGQPDDIAGAVLFLASDLSRWTTGVDLIVDGGMSA